MYICYCFSIKIAGTRFRSGERGAIQMIRRLRGKKSGQSIIQYNNNNFLLLIIDEINYKNNLN